MMIDLNTGQKAENNTKNKIVEVYKTSDINEGQILNLKNDRLDNSNIFKFY